ncbi:M20/M25/M40 family metallo-hydrolase [bacterium]|nr:M20/M25/M40 family metallo-hydrolase [bacterium]
MRKRLVLLTLWCGFCVLQGFSQTVPATGIDSITPEEMKAHVVFLASDQMRGRNTPSPELDSCASFIAAEFASYGLEPADPDHGYYQVFNLLRTRLGTPNSFSARISGMEKEYTIKNDFVPNHETGNGSVTDAPVVFAGYGITAPEYGYDDYTGIDAKGKVVMVFKNEPQADDPASAFEGTKNTDYAQFRVKIDNALDHGAAGIVFLPDPGDPFRRPPNSWPSLLRNPPEDAVPMTLETHTGKTLICITVGKKAAEELIAVSGKTVAELFEGIDSSGKPMSCDIPGLSVSITTTLKGDKIPVNNVVGLWEGRDPQLKDELIVIGGHYDHVGVQNDTIIFNGADDNASGTAGVLEIAEAFSEAGVHPRRTLLFIAFAGEEKGLYGSRFYAEHPLFPLENTVAMLNLDMISRNDSNEVAVIGTRSSTSLKEINEKANAEYVHLDLGYDQERYFLQSDHYSFYKKNVPVIFYNTRDTPDLHKPTDTSDKIIPEKMAKIGRLVFATAWIAAERQERPDFVKFR